MSPAVFRRYLPRILVVLGELVMLWAGLSVLFPGATHPLVPLLSWNLVSFAYLGIGALVMRRRAFSDVAEEPFRRGVRLAWMLDFYRSLLPIVFSLLGLTVSLSVLLGDFDADARVETVLVTKVAASLVMVSAWLMLHVSHARRYQRFWAQAGGLDFPETLQPGSVDFLYFALTVGSSFATSDVTITTPRMRWHVLGHSVLSFFYNAIVLAVGFRILTGG